MGYLSLSDYGLIGNHTSVALISRFGSVDWCCFPYLDSPSHFAALLDQNRGGFLTIAPQGDFRSEQRYLQRTQVLETLFESPHGRAVLVDWMPLESELAHEPILHRRIESLDGKIQWALTCAPRFDYGAHPTRAENHQDGILFRGSQREELGILWGQVPLKITPQENSASAKFTTEPGSIVQFTWNWGRRPRPAQFPNPKATIEEWRTRAHHCPATGCLFAGPWHDAISRSGLIIRLLANTYAGSIAEAATTSIPDALGGPRAWDYRYAWVRNSAFVLQALLGLGFTNEARAYFGWLRDVVIRDGAEYLQSVYTLDGGKELEEQDLGFLSGYHNSSPVRIGNQASRRFQLDVYGHIVLAAAEYHRAFGELPLELWGRLSQIADYICQAWRRPDHGPWEVRSKPEHFVISKVLCWAALDRMLGLARATGNSASERWREERAILHRTVCDQGYDSSQNAFVRSFGDHELDASTLLIPMVGFLPFEDPRVQGTLLAVQNHLSDGVFLTRYRASDGIAGPEGVHLWSSFLFIYCLALDGRADEASDRLAELCTYATPLGMFGEQLDLPRGEMMGNFPSASVHLALVNAALYIAASRGRQLPLPVLLGLPERGPKALSA